MPNPLKPDENVYIDHKIKDGGYSMPTMQAAPDHYTLGYIVSGDRRWISTEVIRLPTLATVALVNPMYIIGIVQCQIHLMTDMF